MKKTKTDSSERKFDSPLIFYLVLTFLFASLSLLFVGIVTTSKKRSSRTKDKNTAVVDKKEEISIGEYFDNEIQEDFGAEDGRTDDPVKEECILFGEKVREGTVNYDTTCVNKPPGL